MKITAPHSVARPPSGGSPGGSAGGDLGGSYPGPIVVGIGGIPITDSPSDGEVPTFDAGAGEIHWELPGSGVMVPYYIAPAETFTVPANKQALFTIPITVDGVLDVIGYLVEVD